MANITHKISTPADPNAFYDAVATLKGLSNWWTTDVTGGVEKDGVLAFRFGDHGGPDFKIEVKEDNRIVWRCISGPEEWMNTFIEFRFEAEDGGLTALYFTHGEWRAETPFHFHCSMKWASFLLSLKEYVELGRGRPFPEDIQIDGATKIRAA